MKLWQWIFVGILLAVFVLLSFFSAKQESLTYDEIVYTQEGNAIFSQSNFSIDPYNPPLVKEILHFGGRRTTIILGYILLLLVFLVAKSSLGVPKALFALFLLTFEPNILAHGHYVTLDMGFTLFFFLSYIFFLQWMRWPSVTRSILLGSMLGAALASKITAIPYFFISAGAVWLLERRKRPRADRKHIYLIIIISMLFMWGVYFFTSDVIVVKHDNPDRVSSRIISYAKGHGILPLAWTMGRLQNQKVPLGTYISIVKNNGIRGRNAVSSEPWYMMLRNVFLKTPLPLLIFFILALKKRNIHFLIPILVILLTSVVSRMNPLVRYVLPLYPFAVLVAAESLEEFKGFFRSLFFIVLVAWYAVGTANQFPHFISYANELAGSKEKLYEKFVDSNIDWGQSLGDVQRYVEKKKPSRLMFSYFGRDNGNTYGFVSDTPWGGYKFEDICAFHTINYPKNSGELTAISISNWYYCGYLKDTRFSKEKISDVVGDSILVFTHK